MSDGGGGSGCVLGSTLLSAAVVSSSPVDDEGVELHCNDDELQPCACGLAAATVVTGSNENSFSDGEKINRVLPHDNAWGTDVILSTEGHAHRRGQHFSS